MKIKQLKLRTCLVLDVLAVGIAFSSFALPDEFSAYLAFISVILMVVSFATRPQSVVYVVDHSGLPYKGTTHLAVVHVPMRTLDHLDYIQQELGSDRQIERYDRIGSVRVTYTRENLRKY